MASVLGHEQGGQGSEDRVQDILSMCPATMGSGLQATLNEAEDSGVLRTKAVDTIKGLLQQVKENIKNPDRSLCSDLQ
ncbi:unnamed protein product, partial [Ectocarpus sp. 4 AP-2014]